MSRSGYNLDWDDGGNWSLICYRGAVAAATKGARGQKLLCDLLDALDKLPERKLIAGEFIEEDGAVCALGAVGQARGVALDGLDPDDTEKVAATFKVAPSLIREIVFENDENGYCSERPEARFTRMRAWVVSQIKN